MSKWRPTLDKNCLYVIPDVHGNLDLLQKVCDRILPLRKSDGIKDTLVFLGDYIDRHVDSHRVLDFLIELQKKYSDQVVFLMGNHELMLLQALNLLPERNYTLESQANIFKMWLKNGGTDTVYGYEIRQGKKVTDSWRDPTRLEVSQIIPQEHKKFLIKNLRKYYQTDEYIFVHGGLEPFIDPEIQDLEMMLWDRSLLKVIKDYLLSCKITKTKPELNWDKTIVCGHSVCPDQNPVITDKYMMLDCGSPQQLLVTELNSKQAYMAYPNKDRMVKFDLMKRKKINKKALFRRSE